MINVKQSYLELDGNTRKHLPVCKQMIDIKKNY